MWRTRCRVVRCDVKSEIRLLVAGTVFIYKNSVSEYYLRGWGLAFLASNKKIEKAICKTCFYIVYLECETAFEKGHIRKTHVCGESVCLHSNQWQPWSVANITISCSFSGFSPVLPSFWTLMLCFYAWSFCFWVLLFTPSALTDKPQLHSLDAGIISALYSLWGFMQICPQHRCLLWLFIPSSYVLWY